nr:MAG TPA: hypothetical protein [Bacteriophage sp.]DAN21535.1 MAG TPA_asm: hypothetical protein [Bacteriophage sp.]
MQIICRICKMKTKKENTMKEYAIFVACEEDKDPNFGGRYVLYTEEEVNTLGGLDAVLAKLKAEGEIITGIQTGEQ